MYKKLRDELVCCKKVSGEFMPFGNYMYDTLVLNELLFKVNLQGFTLYNVVCAMLHIKTQFSPVFFLPISLKSPQCNNQEQTHVLEHSLNSVNLSCIVDLFSVLHELASARACTLLKLAPSVHATLKPKGNTLKSYFPQELARILRFHFSVLRNIAK